MNIFEVKPKYQEHKCDILSKYDASHMNARASLSKRTFKENGGGEVYM
jgi:hypothetical protein